MKSLISIVTPDRDFYRQIVRILPEELAAGQFECAVVDMHLYDSIIFSTQQINGKGVPAYYSMREKNIKRFQRVNVDKYEKGIAWLAPDEKFVDFDIDKQNKYASQYWGTDVTKLVTHPSITACTIEELEDAVRLVKSGELERLQKEREQIEKGNIYNLPPRLYQKQLELDARKIEREKQLKELERLKAEYDAKKKLEEDKEI